MAGLADLIQGSPLAKVLGAGQPEPSPFGLPATGAPASSGSVFQGSTTSGTLEPLAGRYGALSGLSNQLDQRLGSLSISPQTSYTPDVSFRSIAPLLNQGRGGFGNARGDIAAGIMDHVARARGVEPFTGSYTGPQANVGSNRVLQLAQTQLGVPYVFGDLDPAGGGSSGLDCSGLTKWAFGRIGIDLPHSAAQQSQMFPHVGANDMKPGDLVFFSYGRLGAGVADHVGIYEGNGRMIAASSGAGHVIDSQPIDWANFIYGGSTPLGGGGGGGRRRHAGQQQTQQRKRRNAQQR